MKSVIKLIGVYLIAGAACKAGEQLWDEKLKMKIHTIGNHLKRKSKKTES